MLGTLHRHLGLLLIGGAAITAAVLAVGCSNDRRTATTTTTEEPAHEQAYVRFVNANAAQGALDLYFGDTPAFSNIAFKDVTNYQPVPAERRDFQLRTAGATESLATNSEGLWGGRYYTVVAVLTNDGKTEIETITDDFTPPANGKAKLRVFNAAPTAGEIELIEASRNQEIADDVDFKSSEEFREVDPVAGAVLVRGEDHKGTPARIDDVNMKAGRLYTFIVTNDRSGKLEAIRIDESGPMQAAR